jgi:SMC interacting uncharacterized protein involved in chromosome segregation
LYLLRFQNIIHQIQREGKYMIASRAHASLLLTAVCVFTGVLALPQVSVFSQGGECVGLIVENRKLASALADATGRILDNKGSGEAASCEGLEELKAQNESLRETIKAQNEVMAAGGNTAASVEIQKLRNENESLIGLKETIRQLQAQNEHLSAAGNMGKTVTNQVMALQQRIDELRQEVEKEKQNADVYRSKLKESESGAVKGREVCEMNGSDFDQERLTLNKKITGLQLENQELKARIELLNEKEQ